MKLSLCALLAFVPLCVLAEQKTPNVVLIYVDDMGYSDLGCYGAKGWETPNIDRVAKGGIRFTDFYVSQPVCSASRTSLLTGCYANRLGIHGALGPKATHGIADSETTMAEMFRTKGYATHMVGKWHLGHLPRFLPTKHGFDSYLGLPYSNDMWPYHPTTGKKDGYPSLPMIENDKVIVPEVTAEIQRTLTTRYTERAIEKIVECKDKPFFLYVAHSMPHVPLHVSDKFKGKSKQGMYGDVIQEIDWSVGQIDSALIANGLERNTIVIFASDNGPWLTYGNHAGTKGPLREGKGTVFEGGIRVPFIVRWTGTIPAAMVQSTPMMTIDLLPTLAAIIGADLPKLKIDGKNALPLWKNEAGAKSPHEAYYFYYNQNELQAIRSGDWKLILPHNATQMLEDRQGGSDGKPGGLKQIQFAKPMLFNLKKDIGETTDLADKEPEALKAMLAHAETIREELGDKLTKRIGKGNREPGRD
jgi:arylsulfatase A